MIGMANRHDVVKGEEEGRGEGGGGKKDESRPTLARSCRVGNGFSDFSKCEQASQVGLPVRPGHLALPCLSPPQINHKTSISPNYFIIILFLTLSSFNLPLTTITTPHHIPYPYQLPPLATTIIVLHVTLPFIASSFSTPPLTLSAHLFHRLMNPLWGTPGIPL